MEVGQWPDIAQWPDIKFVNTGSSGEPCHRHCPGSDPPRGDRQNEQNSIFIAYTFTWTSTQTFMLSVCQHLTPLTDVPFATDFVLTACKREAGDVV